MFCKYLMKSWFFLSLQIINTIIDIPRPLTNDLWIGLFHFKSKGWFGAGTSLRLKLLFKIVVISVFWYNPQWLRWLHTEGLYLRQNAELWVRAPHNPFFLLICYCLLVLWHYLSFRTVECCISCNFVYFFCFSIQSHFCYCWGLVDQRRWQFSILG